MKRVIFNLFICFAAVMLCSCSALAASLESELNKIYTLQQAKKYQEALNSLAKLKAPKAFCDLKLFIEADCLKALKQHQKALQKYETVLKKYPSGEIAFQCKFLAFLTSYTIFSAELSAQKNMPDSKIKKTVSKLEAMAVKLDTPWQRGTAFNKLSELSSLKAGQKSRFAKLALRAFYTDDVFFKKNSSAKSLIETIISNPKDWVFNDEEWIRIYLKAASEGVLKEKYCTGIYTVLKSCRVIAPLFHAEAYRLDKKNNQALNLYSKVIQDTAGMAELNALAHYLRANAYFSLGSYALASSDYKTALQFSGAFTNRLECFYNLMRSAYKLGADTEAIKLISELCSEPRVKNLLPLHLYEMGLECFDKQNFARSSIYFMQLVKHFQWHYRADDALAYAAMALGVKTAEGEALLDILAQKYPNSFFIVWLLPKSANRPITFAKYKPIALKHGLKERLAVIKRLWGTKYSIHAKNEAARLTEANPNNLELFRQIIKIAEEQNDYQQVVTYAERLEHNLLKNGRALGVMPSWAIKALYPLAYYDIVKANSEKFGIDSMWAISIMREESHFKTDTLSRSNAMGLMQILPDTGKWISKKLGEKSFKKSKLYNVDVNIKYGTWYLSFLYEMFNKNLYLASAAYNGGQGNILRKVVNGPYASKPVLECLDKVPLPETRDYYKKVMGSYWVYKRLYK